jgi:hypothetical protein
LPIPRWCSTSQAGLSQQGSGRNSAPGCPLKIFQNEESVYMYGLFKSSITQQTGRAEYT